jgi:hypothetical protein
MKLLLALVAVVVGAILVLPLLSEPGATIPDINSASNPVSGAARPDGSRGVGYADIKVQFAFDAGAEGTLVPFWQKLTISEQLGTATAAVMLPKAPVASSASCAAQLRLTVPAIETVTSLAFSGQFAAGEVVTFTYGHLYLVDKVQYSLIFELSLSSCSFSSGDAVIKRCYSVTFDGIVGDEQQVGC